MGIFNFFKKIAINKEIEKIEKITFFEIENWIKNKIKENEIKEKDIFVLVENKISVFANELKGKIRVLESVDIESKKVESKIKFIVNEGRKKYIESVEGFIEKLENLEREKLEKFIEGINKVFLYFNKNSYMSYERTTILIGKEMADIKESLKIFSRDLMKLFDENKNIVDSSKTISLIKLKLNQITEIDRILKEVDETVIFFNRKITKKKEENKIFFGEIEKIKQSPNYLERLKKQEKIEFLKEDLEKDIRILKQLINFKALANFFHIFNEQMSIVKSHRENFQTAFKKDSGESIIGLLNESKLNNKMISEKIKQIKSKTEKITKNKQEIKKDKTQELYSETTKIILEIENLKNEREKEKKRSEKLKTSKEEIMGVMRNEFRKIGVEIE